MDDDESVRTLVTKMLQSCGYTVVGTTGGKETTETFVEDTRRGKPFAGMILDLTIPGGSGGKEVAEEIRKTDAAIPLFVSSGYAGDPILADPTAYGFDAALSKPYKMAELMEVLEKHIKRSR
jgi:CheY-like chemotaxis protein